MTDKEDKKDKKKDKDSDEQESSGPTGKVNNISFGGNLLEDSFFDSLGDIDDGLGIPSFKKVSTDSIDEILNDSSLDLSPKEESKKEETKQKKLTAKFLPASPLPGNSKVKEKPMTTNANKKFDPLDLPDDDPNAKQLNEIWAHMNTPDAAEFKLMVMRLEPQVIKGTKVSGYLETFHLPTTIPDIIEQVGQKYGGGKFQIRIVDGAGKYVKSKTFEISGLPKITQEAPNAEKEEEGSNNTSSVISSPKSVASSSNNDDDDDDGEDIDDDDWPAEDFYSRPRPSMGSYQSPYQSPYQQQQTGFRGGFQRDSFRSPYMQETKDDSVKEIEEKITSKIDSKFDKMSDMMQNLVMMNQNKKSDSFLNADVVKALAPVVVTWLDGKSSRDTTHTSQISETNKQMAGLMEGMQNLVRLSDKSKEDYSEKERRAREEFAERERREREQARKESLDYQRMMEEKFADERRRSEERHQAMIQQMRDALESKHKVAIESTSTTQMQLEKMRSEFREKEERNRLEAREREERLREEARKRDEEARRREMEFWQKQRSDELKWREEMRIKEEDARQRELQWREEIRQREVEKERELKMRELEMMKTIQEMNSQKSGMQQKLIEQIYSNNNTNRESQLQMEMAIARMTSDNEARMMQANAEMQLEKIRHATQMQMTKMKGEMAAVENKKEEDPLDSAMQDYLKRRLQLDMVKELNMDIAEDETSSSGIMGIAKKLLTEGAGPMLLNLLMGGGGGGLLQPGMAAPAAAGRVVAPNPSPAPRPVTPTPTPAPPPTNIHDLDDYDDEEDDEDEDYEDEDTDIEDSEDTEDSEDDQDEITPPDVDLYKEIPRVAEFFQYLKEAIEAGNITPVAAAEEGKTRLSSEIVSFLMQIKDSRVVIQQLYPLLSNLGGDEFAQFFVTEQSYNFMDKMLLAMAGELVEEEPKTENPKKKTKSIPKKKAEAVAIPEKDNSEVEKVEEEKPKTTRRGRKKKPPTT